MILARSFIARLLRRSVHQHAGDDARQHAERGDPGRLVELAPGGPWRASRSRARQRLRKFYPSRLSSISGMLLLRKKAAGGCVDLGGLHERSRSQPTRLVSVWETRDAFLHGFHRNDSNAALCQPFAPFIELLWYPHKISWLVCDDFRASTKMFTLECAMSYCNWGLLMQKVFIEGGLIRKFWSVETDAYRDHLLRLDPESRHNRFNATIADDTVRGYAATARGSDVILHGFFVDGVLRGVADLRILGREAEVAFSIEKRWQSHGVGSALLERSLLAARNRGAKLLQVCCLVDNYRMQQLARKFEARLTFDCGTVIGTLENPQPTPLSLMQEMVADGHSFAAAYVDFQSHLLKQGLSRHDFRIRVRSECNRRSLSRVLFGRATHGGRSAHALPSPHPHQKTTRWLKELPPAAEAAVPASLVRGWGRKRREE